MSRRKKREALSSRTANDTWRHVSVYLPKELFRKIDLGAQQARRSLSSEIVVMLESVVKRRGKNLLH